MRRTRNLALALLALLPIARVQAHKDAQPFQRGVCYASAWRGDAGYGSATSARTLARLHALGVEWISLTPFGFMDSPSALEVRGLGTHGAESDERLAREVAVAHKLGMKVALKPHLWIRHGEWQGDLKWANDAAWQEWFASYRRFILRYAGLAERDHYDLFVLGTELKSATACDQSCWRALISDLRHAYHGAITYAANWDEAEKVPFWDALDFVGVDAYAPIATRRGASDKELCLAWELLAKELEGLSRRTGKRIILTEIGYRAARDAAMAPATWPEMDRAAVADPAHQASCFRAGFSALWGRSWLAGIYVWKVFSDDKDEEGATDFAISGKAAEAVVREFYSRDFIRN
jgi:hypothetical protein